MSKRPDASEPFSAIKAATRSHQRDHGCGAYTFDDGAGLSALAALHSPARILELGTALGYTACCLASGSSRARVDTIERDPIHVGLARRNIAAANLADRVTVHHGDFAAVLPSLGQTYDLAFFDGFAPTTAVLNAMRRLLAVGGVFVCANLGLAPTSEAERIKILFEDPMAWRSLPSIEGGETSAWLKLDADAV